MSVFSSTIPLSITCLAQFHGYQAAIMQITGEHIWNQHLIFDVDATHERNGHFHSVFRETDVLNRLSAVGEQLLVPFVYGYAKMNVNHHPPTAETFCRNPSILTSKIIWLLLHENPTVRIVISAFEQGILSRCLTRLLEGNSLAIAQLGLKNRRP